jgi:hypothetical protein
MIAGISQSPRPKDLRDHGGRLGLPHVRGWWSAVGDVYPASWDGDHEPFGAQDAQGLFGGAFGDPVLLVYLDDWRTNWLLAGQLIVALQQFTVTTLDARQPAAARAQ